MKFVGKTPKECFDKLCSAKYEKYLDADAKLQVPSNCYDGVQKCADEKIKALQKQADALKAKGNNDVALKEKLDEIDKIKKLKGSLKKSHVSTKEAMEARINPKLSTAKEVALLSHHAGMTGAGIGAGIEGARALVQNVTEWANGDKDGKEAALDVASATGKGAAKGYAMASLSSFIKSLMQNSASKTARTLSKTSLPAYIVTTTMELSKTLTRFISGKIDGGECLEKLGEKGTGMLSSAMFATIGQAVIPIPVVGGLIGGMVGYVLNSAFYQSLMESKKNAKLAYEERLKVEAYCEEAIKAANFYQDSLEKQINEYLSENITLFRDSFALMLQAIQEDDIDAFIAGNVAIQRQLGHKVQFTNMDEFDAFMASDEPLEL